MANDPNTDDLALLDRYWRATPRSPLGEGGPDYNDQDRIWAAFDKALAKHADMVLLHGGSPRVPSAWQRAGPKPVA